MKKVIIILYLLSLTMMIACSPTVDVNNSEPFPSINNNNLNVANNTGEELMEKEVTNEWIKEQFDFTDEDLDGLNIEEISKALWWTQEEVIKEYGGNSERLLSVLKASQNQLNQMQNSQSSSEYSSLWNSDSSGEIQDFDNLKTIEFIATSQDEGIVSIISGLLDFENKKIYYLDGGVVSDLIGTNYPVAQNIEECDITDEEIDTILNSLNKEFLSNDEGSISLWSVAFEKNDGSVYRYQIKDANLDSEKLAMINIFFEKINPKTKMRGAFKLWSDK